MLACGWFIPGSCWSFFGNSNSGLALPPSLWYSLQETEYNMCSTSWLFGDEHWLLYTRQGYFWHDPLHNQDNWCISRKDYQYCFVPESRSPFSRLSPIWRITSPWDSSSCVPSHHGTTYFPFTCLLRYPNNSGFSHYSHQSTSRWRWLGQIEMGPKISIVHSSPLSYAFLLTLLLTSYGMLMPPIRLMMIATVTQAAFLPLSKAQPAVLLPNKSPFQKLHWNRTHWSPWQIRWHSMDMTFPWSSRLQNHFKHHLSGLYEYSFPCQKWLCF